MAAQVTTKWYSGLKQIYTSSHKSLNNIWLIWRLICLQGARIQRRNDVWGMLECCAKCTQEKNRYLRIFAIDFAAAKVFPYARNCSANNILISILFEDVTFANINETYEIRLNMLCKEMEMSNIKMIIIILVKTNLHVMTYVQNISNILRIYVWYIGVNDIKIDLPGKKVLVTTALSSDEILETIKKTGKTCQFLETH